MAWSSLASPASPWPLPRLLTPPFFPLSVLSALKILPSYWPVSSFLANENNTYLQCIKRLFHSKQGLHREILSWNGQTDGQTSYLCKHVYVVLFIIKCTYINGKLFSEVELLANICECLTWWRSCLPGLPVVLYSLLERLSVFVLIMHLSCRLGKTHLIASAMYSGKHFHDMQQKSMNKQQFHLLTPIHLKNEYGENDQGGCELSQTSIH